MQVERGLAILGDGDAGEAADELQRLAADDRRRAAEEGAVPLVEPLLDDAVEHFVLRRHGLEGLEIALQRIGIGEEMRGLAEEQLRVLAEIADRLLQELAHRHMVGVEHDDELAFGLLEAVVHVAGLGVLVLGARHVFRAQLLGERGQLGATLLRFLGLLDVVLVALLVGAAVVEQPDGELVLGIIEVDGGDHRHRQQFGVLVVGGDIDVDRRQGLRRQGLGRLALQRVGDDEEADRQHHRRVDLGHVEQHAGNEVPGIADRRDRVDRAPEEIADDDRASEREENMPPGTRQPESPDRGHARERRDPDHELRADADGLGGQNDEREPRAQPQGLSDRPLHTPHARDYPPVRRAA